MATFRLKYVTQDVDRHGNVRCYFRRKGQKKIRLPGKIGSEEFMAAYGAALDGSLKPTLPEIDDARNAPRGSLRWLVTQYLGSVEYAGLDPSTQRTRRAILEALCERKGKKTGTPNGVKPAAAIQPRHVFAWRDEKAATPAAATNLVKALRALFKWAVARQHLTANPAKDVPYLRTHSGGHHSWTIEEVEQYEATHPVGTMARLALALFLYTSQRVSDVAQMGLQHRQGDFLTFTQWKNRNSEKRVTLTIPIIRPLREIIEATPRPSNAKTMAFLVNEYGNAFSIKGLSNKMRDWCDAAGLTHCSSHGLRKAFSARAVELELTSWELGAITGHVTLEELERYTRAARQRVLAEQGMAKFEAAYNRSGESETGS